MTNLKQKIVIFLTTIIVLYVFAACGPKAICDFCGEEKVCEVRSMLGEEVHICDDCLDEITGLAE